MAARGRGKQRAFPFGIDKRGSVTDRGLGHTSCPVILSKRPTEEEWIKLCVLHCPVAVCYEDIPRLPCWATVYKSAKMCIMRVTGVRDW